MNEEVNPYRELNADISAVDFEKFCLETLKSYAINEGFQKYTIEHNKKVIAFDGIYQIDVLIDFMAFGLEHRILVECKKVKRNIERNVVAELYAKMQSIGAQKGIIMSTAGFQSGATEFARQHGIALWQICDRRIKHFYNSVNHNPEFLILCKIKHLMDNYLPRHFVMEWDLKYDFPYKEIYPTAEMYKCAEKKVKKLI